MKPKGNQLDKTFLSPSFSILNGNHQILGDDIPTWLLFYEPDKTDKTHEKVKLWLKLEDCNIQEIKQINRNLIEISIWFDDVDIVRIKSFFDRINNTNIQNNNNSQQKLDII